MRGGVILLCFGGSVKKIRLVLCIWGRECRRLGKKENRKADERKEPMEE
jgi:hypothetical protein